MLVAIRENEQRAQFVGYATNRYKQIAYVVSAVLTGCAGVLFAFHHRFASADPTSIAFSGALLAMVLIGGMRSLLGPALGALFYILFQEYLSIWTPNWLLYFGLLFVGFIVFSPTGLVGIWRRVTEPFRPKVVEAAAMSARAIEQGVPLPEFLKHAPHEGGVVLEARGLAKAFGGIKAVTDASLSVRDRSLHALIGPNGAGKTTVFNLVTGMFAPDAVRSMLAGQSIAGLPPYRIAAAGLGRSFQITNLFPRVSIAENLRLAVQARDASHFDGWADAQRNERVTSRTAELIRYLGLSGIEAGRGRFAFLWRPALARHGAGARRRAARAAARRAAGGARRGRARARRRPDQAHLGRRARTAGRARHRPRVRAGRPRDGDERGQGPGRRHRGRRAGKRRRCARCTSVRAPRRLPPSRAATRNAPAVR